MFVSIHVCTFKHVWMSVCVSVSVSVRERERERDIWKYYNALSLISHNPELFHYEDHNFPPHYFSLVTMLVLFLRK